MNKKLNILEIMVQDRFRSGGAVQMYRLSLELSKRGHNVYVVYSYNPEFQDDFKELEKEKIDISFMKMERVKFNKETIKTLKEVRKFIKEKKIDIIHAHKGTAVDVTYLATIGLDIPIVTNRGVINSLNFFNSLKYKTKKVKKIISVSQAVKNVMHNTGKINEDKIEVVFGSVDTEVFSPEIKTDIKDKYKLKDDYKVIGFAGNAGKRKGLIYLAEAIQKIFAEYEKTYFLLVGVDKEEILKFNIKEEYLDRVIPLGYRKDVPNCMAAMDIFAFSGIAEEGLTGTVREAGAMGLPVITTDVAGNTELVKDGENGLVVPKKDSEALYKAIKHLLDNEEEGKKYATNIRAFILENMNNEVRGNKIEKIYYDVLNIKK